MYTLTLQVHILPQLHVHTHFMNIWTTPHPHNIINTVGCRKLQKLMLGTLATEQKHLTHEFHHLAY